MTNPLCIHGKQSWEHCVGCCSDLLLGKSNGFTRELPPSNSLLSDTDLRALVRAYARKPPAVFSEQVFMCLQELVEARGTIRDLNSLNIELGRANAEEVANLRRAAHEPEVGTIAARFARLVERCEAHFGIEPQPYSSEGPETRIWAAMQAASSQPPVPELDDAIRNNNLKDITIAGLQSTLDRLTAAVDRHLTVIDAIADPAVSQAEARIHAAATLPELLEALSDAKRHTVTKRPDYCKCSFTDDDGTVVPGEPCPIHPGGAS